MKKLIIIFLFGANITNAQTINFNSISSDKKNNIQASFGLNMAIMANLEYGRVIAIKEKLYVLSTNITLPMGNKAFDDNKLAINLSGNSLTYKNWQLPIHIGLFSSFARNKMNQISTLGTQIAINPGYYKASWFIAADITYDKFMLSHIKNSDYYREAYFQEAQDGWYKNSGGNFHFGIIAGKTLNKGELNVKLGTITTESLNTITLPYYGQIGYKFAF